MLKFFCFVEGLLPVVFWVIMIFGFDALYVGVLTLAAALIHELAHIAVLNAFSCDRTLLPSGKLSGLRIRCGTLSYKAEALCAAAGPLANVIVWLLLLPFCTRSALGYYISCFAMLNLMCGISNALPIEGYDGYRVLSCVIMQGARHPREAERRLELLSLLLSFALTLFSLYLMLRSNGGYWIFAVFFSSLVSGIFKRQSKTICENTRENESF